MAKNKLISKARLFGLSSVLPFAFNCFVLLSYTRLAFTSPSESLSRRTPSPIKLSAVINGLFIGSSIKIFPDKRPSSLFFGKRNGAKSPAFTFFNSMTRSFQSPISDGLVFILTSWLLSLSTTCPLAGMFFRNSNSPFSSIVHVFPLTMKDDGSNSILTPLL